MTQRDAGAVRGVRWLALAVALGVVLGGSWLTARSIQGAPDDPARTVPAVASPAAAAAGAPPAPAASPVASPAAGSVTSPPAGPAAAELPQTRVTFPAGELSVPPGARRDLDQVAAYVKAHAATYVIVLAATDGSGTTAARRGMDRAHAVQDYLCDRGVPADRITHDTFSDRLPAAGGAAKGGQVEVIVRKLPS